ncbi:MAG: hypothetical protein H6819_05435 [Phycisphaerales bacterium]|nr:hypothetical protein [Phycisphaerales bacterium]MCB9854778.1 hypothetical protein [Phycisphaerales bacterium]MCB9863750.1 hypothetical protein [Phycisphaerales bacterium]
MTIAQLVDWGAILLAATVPVLAVRRFGRLGIIIGGLAVWFILGAAGPVLNALDPKRDAAVVDSIWILGGWVGGLIYASMIYALLMAFRIGGPRLRPRTNEDVTTRNG